MSILWIREWFESCRFFQRRRMQVSSLQFEAVPNSVTSSRGLSDFHYPGTYELSSMSQHLTLFYNADLNYSYKSKTKTTCIFFCLKLELKWSGLHVRGQNPDTSRQSDGITQKKRDSQAKWPLGNFKRGDARHPRRPCIVPVRLRNPVRFEVA